MELPTTDDLITEACQEIVEALNNPSPLASIQKESPTMERITNILTNLLEPRKEDVKAPVLEPTSPAVATPPPRKVLAKPKVVPMKAPTAIKTPKYSKCIVTPEKPKETQVQFSRHNNYYGPLFDDDNEDDEPVPAQDPAPPLRVEKRGDSKDDSVPPLRVETIEKEAEPAMTRVPAIPPWAISPEKPKRKQHRQSKRLKQAQRHLINHAQVSDNKILEDRIAVSAEEKN
jgi:hypothetical protein